jgi:hypothetical protein
MGGPWTHGDDGRDTDGMHGADREYYELLCVSSASDHNLAAVRDRLPPIGPMIKSVPSRPPEGASLRSRLAALCAAFSWFRRATLRGLDKQGDWLDSQLCAFFRCYFCTAIWGSKSSKVPK